MFPDRQPLSPTTASAEIQKLTASNLGDIPVEKIDSLYETGAKRAVETIAQLKVDYRYEVDIEDGYTYDSTAHTFTCKFKVTSANDSAVSSTDIVLNLVEDQKETLQQKINNMLGEVDIEDSDITTFKTNLNNYSQKYLEDYTSIYKECTKVLSERGYDNKDKVSTDLYNFYHDYWEKWKACEEALAIRKSQVATASENKKELENKLKELQDKLNFEKCLGGYYEEFCKYRREDTYQNDNYISDGMNTSELFKNAKQLVETATKELIKASTFQTTYTANLNNLFTNPIYEPFYEHFELFNWIHADIDDKHIMLRLIGITFDFSAIDKIEVEFSEQVRNANGLTDLQSILGQAKSMATSYSSTVKQALNGSEVSLEFDSLKQEGLNSALMNIKNSNNEEVVIDNCGINCKSKDQNDQYDMHQLRITGKNIVLTDDGFETASLAIGLMTIGGEECYGIVGDCIIGDLLISKTLHINNGKDTLIMDENGLTITNGVNTIIFDPNNTELMRVTNMDKKIFYFNELGDLFIDGNIFGGSLHLENENGVYVDIDPEKSDIMEIGKDYIDVKKVPQKWKRATNGGTFSGGDTFNGFSKEDSYYYSIYNVTKLVCQNQTICIDGVNYLVFLTKLKKYQNGTWITLGDFESVSGLSDRDRNKCYGNNFIVKRKENDGYIYIVCYSHGNYQNTHGCIIRYDINNQKFEKVNTYSMNSISYADASSYVMQGDVIYKAEDSTSTSILGEYSHKLTLDYTGGEITPVSWNNGNKQIRECFVYNNEFYAIIGYKKANSLVKIDDIETISYTISIPLQGTSANTFNEEYVYFVPILNENHVYIYFLNDYSYMSNAQNSKISCRIVNLLDNTYVDEECELYLDTRIGGSDTYNHSRNYRRGVFGICENGEIHLFNGAIKASYAWSPGEYSNNAYSVSWYGNPTYLSNEEHYVYNPSEEYELSNMIKEKQTGRDFLSSQQKCFAHIGDVIYCINSNFTFDNNKGSTRYDGGTSFTMNNYVKKLDLSSSNDANWQLVGTVSTTTSDSGYHVKFRNIIQSNSNTYVYIHYCYVNRDSIYDGIARFDTITNTFTYYNGTEWVDDYTLSSIVSASGNIEFGYYDEANNVLYSISSTAFSKIENFATSTDIYTHSFSMISNIIWDVDKAYFVASYGVDYRLYSLTFDGTLTELQQIPSVSYANSTGFSIAKIEDIISIIHSNYDTLPASFYFYNIKTNMIIEKFGMFKDTGLYTVETSEYGTSSPYRTCFVPQITTSSGIHMFIGKPQFEDKNANINGGYKHYVMQLTEEEILQTTTDKRIMYVTENGDAYFKGTVYAEDGYFKGDIYANKLTLGEDAVVSGNISATTGSIGGWTINEKSISGYNTTNNTGITLNSTGDIFSYGTNQWMWLNGGNMYFGIGKAVGFTKAYSQISSNGVYVASNKSTEVGKYLFEANANYDCVAISTHTPAQSALFVYNDSNTDTDNIGGMASCVTMKTDYAGFSNRPLDIMTKTGNDDGTQTYVYMNVFGEYRGAGDGSSYDTSGRLTLRSAINTGTDWIGNDSSLSNGYIPSSIGSTTFRWGQGFFHDLTITNPLKVTSDKKLKDHIGYLDSKESLEFINHLQPAEYTMTYSENKRVHRGFYAQDVSKVSNNMGFDNLSLYSAYVEKDGEISPYDANEDDENLRWSLSYDEFIAPMVSAMQELSKENNELKDKVTELEGRLEKLEKLLLEK